MEGEPISALSFEWRNTQSEAVAANWGNENFFSAHIGWIFRGQICSESKTNAALRSRDVVFPRKPAKSARSKALTDNINFSDPAAATIFDLRASFCPP
jgi:hypothetical protein